MPPTQGPILYLAPFQGITDAIYRTSFNRYFGGLDAAFTPYISGTGTEKVSKNKLIDVLPEVNQAIRTIPQILSKDADEMLLLSKSLAALGYSEVNWNMGCPFSRVARKQRGSGMLPYPELVRQILDKLYQEGMPLGLSVKMRTGYNGHEDILAMIDVLNDFPLTEVIVHPRTGKQLYKGEASETAFSAIVDKVKSPLAWNGDIFSVEKFRELQDKFPSIQRWMIGRGALINPVLPLMISHPDAAKSIDWRKALSGFLQDIYLETYYRNEGRTAVVSRMKSLWVYLRESFENPTEAFRVIRKTRTPEEYLEAEMKVIADAELKLFY
ncbi:MAG TPA: dihydrouridine synthase [Bacteroidales bacterium]|nr:MAG: hypothetical protein A2X11_06615 [Bacteroidetes bacterium GWE2_42_24]OFY25683.1 MAG: hypothetical protein A2X09_01840 [Bacteroidetes bacterium GWF2_43_11]HAQ64602.1 dihydrouridine synthase [Bacteroidales bacterium]HBZ68057.1 dihydrouridine synthase [Bacteroidales bacterium]